MSWMPLVNMKQNTKKKEVRLRMNYLNKKEKVNNLKIIMTLRRNFKAMKIQTKNLIITLIVLLKIMILVHQRLEREVIIQEIP